MPSSELVLGALLGVNAALYASLIYVTLLRRRRVPEPSNLGEAFASLELALMYALPDLPSGFTWEEAVERLKSSGVRTDAMEGALRSYEAFRYGGAPLPDMDYHAVFNVAKMLGSRSPARRGGVVLGR